jgi:BirA family biotin operon repressor/biotin-[acetyl-CoA-carboxylase] ligase
MRAVADGAGHGDVFVAGRQTAGRGRRGRRWDSPAGNLHVSLVVEPPPDARIGQLAFVAALGAGAAIDELAPAGARLGYKWPNDLLLNGRKVGGILIEAMTGDMRVGAVIVGVGINLVHAPDDAGWPATSLCAEGAPELAIGPALEALCRGFHHWYGRWRDDGFAELRAAWLARAAGIGGPMEARLADGTLHGRFKGIDQGGALILEQDGRERLISAGDVFPATV